MVVQRRSEEAEASGERRAVAGEGGGDRRVRGGRWDSGRRERHAELMPWAKAGKLKLYQGGIETAGISLESLGGRIFHHVHSSLLGARYRMLIMEHRRL